MTLNVVIFNSHVKLQCSYLLLYDKVHYRYIMGNYDIVCIFCICCVYHLFSHLIFISNVNPLVKCSEMSRLRRFDFQNLTY